MTDQAVNRDPVITALLAIIPESAISPLWTMSDGFNRHPLCELIGNMANPSPIARATIHAMRLVNQNEPEWMKALRNRILSNEFTTAAAALGEIRAYGTLVMAKLNPKPISQKGNPDFKLELDQQTIIVEVHTRQMDDAERAKLAAWANAAEAVAPCPGVSVYSSPSIPPFGEPDPAKPSDTVIGSRLKNISFKTKEPMCFG